MIWLYQKKFGWFNQTFCLVDSIKSFSKCIIIKFLLSKGSFRCFNQIGTFARFNQKIYFNQINLCDLTKFLWISNNTVLLIEETFFCACTLRVCDILYHKSNLVYSDFFPQF